MICVCDFIWTGQKCQIVTDLSRIRFMATVKPMSSVWSSYKMKSSLDVDVLILVGSGPNRDTRHNRPLVSRHRYTERPVYLVRQSSWHMEHVTTVTYWGQFIDAEITNFMPEWCDISPHLLTWDSWCNGWKFLRICTRCQIAKCYWINSRPFAYPLLHHTFPGH